MPNVIASRLRAVMRQKGITSSELAKRSDVKPSFVYDILNGKSTNPSTLKLAKVADTLGISLSFLAGKDAESDVTTVHFDAPPQSEYVAISPLLMQGFLGKGGYNPAEQREGPYYFRKSWLRDRLQVNADDLRIVFVRGDDMEPTLCNNDIVLIDTGKKSPTPPGLFVIYDGIGTVVKRLEFITGSLPPSLRVISDNPTYPPVERTVDETHILGRVVWFAREM
jgi:phage repressor protein C with HTH and peptisase S24 domain